MESVGVKLRNERVRQGLSLDALSAKTCIPLKSLQAIEDDRHAEISPSFFYKSFVRQFAERLGMNYSELAPSVESIMRGAAEPIAHHANIDPMLPKIAPLQPIQPKKFRGLFSMVALICVLFACSGLYAMWEGSRSAAVKSIEQSDHTADGHTHVSALRLSTASSFQAR